MTKQKCFSLIELLIVVAIILIIAAIAIPNLMRARMSANESSAAGSIRTINTGEVSYATTYPTQGFTNLASLGGAGSPCVPAPAGGCFIDNFLANTATKDGYGFSATPGATVPAVTYVSLATTLSPNQSGTRAFCSDQTGVIYFDPTAGGTGCTPGVAPATALQ